LGFANRVSPEEILAEVKNRVTQDLTQFPPDGAIAIMAFAGWNDAGEAATGVINHLIESFNAQEVDSINPDEYYDYQIARPRVKIEDSKRIIEWSTTKFFLAPAGNQKPAFVFVQGIEPNLKWQAFCLEIMKKLTTLNVKSVISLGALLADAPHTRPIAVTAVANESSLSKYLGLEVSSYEGPTGIIGVIHNYLQNSDIPTISLWAALPHYVSSPPSPKGSLALISRIEDLTNIDLPRGDLPEEARAWQVGVDEMAQEDEEIADYITRLEENVDATDLPEASGEAIAREFERYLKRRSSD
jgi:predicted ATP-grasp superfamily ATP-dependent carboligase